MDTRLILAEQLKAGRIKPHHLLGSIKPNDSIVVGSKKVSVRKVRAGMFHIEVGDADKEKGDVVDTLDSPASAKLAFIDKMVELLPEPDKK